MSAKLEWQIEAERTEQRAQDDPALRRQRRRQRIILILITSVIIAIVGGIVGAIAWRLNMVDTRLRQTLIDTARAEISALRIGDRVTFNGLMESADAAWLVDQTNRFDSYQTLMAQGALQFVDQIPDEDAVVDSPRGRVLTTEIVNGQTYHVLWYFWHYDKTGWRQVPSDLTFWGDPAEINGQTTSVQYDSLDTPLATDLSARVERWWTAGCQYLACTGLPHLSIHVVHQYGLPPSAWEKSVLTLDVNSPLVTGDRVLADPPLPPDLEATIAGQIADKLFDQASGQLPVSTDADAAWLRREIVDWVTALLLGRGNVQQLSFMQSLSDNYGGSQAVVTLMRLLRPNADIGVLASAFGQPLDQLKVDWREFFQWRLGLEKDLIQGGKNNQTRYQSLWDSSATTAAQERWNSPNQALPQVQSVTPGTDRALGPVATVQATLNGLPVTLRFRVINGTWKRLS